MRRARRTTNDWKILVLVFLAAAIPTLGTLTLMRVSSHKSVAENTFLEWPAGTDAVPVDWPMLERLNEERGTLTKEEQLMLHSVIGVPGYMVRFDEGVDSIGMITRFLLVPDPGNWIHPPHLDPDGVVIVRMSSGAKTHFFGGKPVWVIGRLFVSRVETSRLDAKFQLNAISVREAHELK